MKKKTMKFLLSAVLLVPALTGLIPCAANAQVDPGGIHNPEALPAALPPSQPPAPAAATVVVTNTASTPLYTVNADAAGRRPYVMFAEQRFDSADGIYDSFPNSGPALTNNTTKLFVITNFSSSANMNTKDVLMNCDVTMSSTAATGGIPALGSQQTVVPATYSGVQQVPTSPTVVYTANAAILMYLLPSQKVTVSCTRGAATAQTLGDGTTEFVTVNLTGHLEDVPAASVP
jgi:hypothetical protein